MQRVNRERQTAGLEPLGFNEALSRAAHEHARDMVDNDYFDHESLDGQSFADRVDAAGYAGFATAENIAAGQRSASAVMDSWMRSPGHRSNILSGRSNEIGVGRVENHWVQVFGRR